MSNNERRISDLAVPPGEFLAEELDARGMSQKDLALRTGRPEQTISAIINGKKAITQDTALELEKVLGIPAVFWVNLEGSYRLTRARERESTELEKQHDWLSAFPVKEMQQRDLLPKTQQKEDLLRALLGFFGAASFSALREKEHAVLGYRVTAGSAVNEAALWSWLREGENAGDAIETRPYDEGAFRERLREIRPLTRQHPNVAFPAVREICASAGVAFVVVKEYPKSGANGVARWLGPEKALIQLSTKRRWTDIFWFSFFHEAYHVLEAHKKKVFVNGIGQDDSSEVSADQFAARTLIPDEAWATFLQRAVTPSTVRSFSNQLDLDVGIVVGRLQHERVIGFQQMNDLRKRFVWSSDS